MAPISPAGSLKRSRSPTEDSPAEEEGHQSKKIRTESVADEEAQEEVQEKFQEQAQTPTPKVAVKYGGVNPELFDEIPHQLLKRSVAVILEHVGFSAASPEALEALCSEVETYASVFLSQVTTSMMGARRGLPTPLDFDHALKQFSLPFASLEPHLKPPVRPEYLQTLLEGPSPEQITTLPIEELMGTELSGKQEKESKLYIPKHLPPFPSKHTYKWTEKDSTRETDARKIREKASQQARQGEEALRNLTAQGKKGNEKGVKNTADKAPKSKQRHQLWEEAQGPGLPPSAAHDAKEVERSIVVNANSSYHRKGAAFRRKGAPQILPPELFGNI